MKKISINEAKQILLTVLDEYAEFCNKNGLRYFLAAGTLLGAVRHDGFIPWDDDIDIYMPRPDYEEFIKLYPKEGINVLNEFRTNEKYMYPFAKLCKRNTLCKERGGYGGVEMGIYIDIFPVDGLGNEYKVARKIVRKVTRYVNMNLSLLVKQWRKDVSFIKNMAIWVLHGFSRLYGGHTKIIKKMNDILLKNDFDKCKYVGQLVEMPRYSKITDRTMYEKSIQHNFEGKEYNIPADYDEILKKLYGDYMTLPPVEKRVYAHGYEAYVFDNNEDRGTGEKKMKKYKIGYTCGVFDVFHVGHLNLLERCKEYCDKLYVGVCDDRYVKIKKNKEPVYSENDRVRIINALKCVDGAFLVTIEETDDKTKVFDRCRFDVLFSGDDWKGSERYKRTEEEFKKIGIDIVYLPYTQGISTSQIREKIKEG